MAKIILVTGNMKKLISARQFLEPHGIQVDNVKMDTTEIQSDSIEEMLSNAKKTIPRLFKSIKNLNEDQMKNISKVATIFIKESFQNLFDSIKGFKLIK